MPLAVISAFNVARFPEGGGHFWVYLQYALGLRLLGYDVYWLEAFRTYDRDHHEAAALARFKTLMEQYGFGGKCIVYVTRSKEVSPQAPSEYLTTTRAEAEAVFEQADLLLNFHYHVSPGLLALFRRTALVDIDPGLLQFWISHGQLTVPRHDFYFTTGETIGKPGSLVSDCGLRWTYFRPPVCLERWPYVFNPRSDAFTTVSNWDSPDWIVGDGDAYDNSKRLAFLEFADLPRLTPQPLELALLLRTKRDMAERKELESRGWRIRQSRDVAATPGMYQAHIQASRGEFSCAKRSCLRFQNAWISDRTVCYLASGKPVVVQNTGPSSFLPNGEGMFRFSTPREAADAFDAINADYEGHCQAARAIAQNYFDARRTIQTILDVALSNQRTLIPKRRLEQAADSGVYVSRERAAPVREHHPGAASDEISPA